MQALRASQVPVIATVRVKSLHDDVVFAAVRAFAGANVKAVEVDYDCAASQLAAYATWLRATQHTLGDVPLAITALPSWLDHVDHNAVFDAAREVVLQVHSVRAPALLDVKAAVASVKRAQAERPTIRIALPTYAVSLKNGAQLHAVVGDVVAVKVVASRIAWFRFPGDGDDGAWDLVTLGAVDGSSGYSAGMALGTTVADDGARLLHVRNTGAVALPFPCVALDFVGDFDDGAAAYDAHAGFVVDGCAICPASARFVFGHSDVVVGWARPSVSGDLHASTVSAAVAVGSRHRCRR